MNIKEKEILRGVVDYHKGDLSPNDMINVVAKRDNRSVQNLIAKGYIEEFHKYINNISYNFYRSTEKGMMYFDKWYKKLFFNIKGDIRSIIVSFITTAIIYILMKIFFNN